MSLPRHSCFTYSAPAPIASAVSSSTSSSQTSVYQSSQSSRRARGRRARAPTPTRTSMSMSKVINRPLRLVRPRLAASLSSAARPHFPLWLDGAPAEAKDGKTIDVEDPSTGEVYATTALGSEADIDAAVASAKACHEDGEWRPASHRLPSTQPQELKSARLVGVEF